tara:strand:- start:226 stop:1962 length:1737 start_codon:yes stop_codon:yes gene_type:complete
MTIKVIKFKKLKSGNKKYEITFNKNGKVYVRKFGAFGASDYTKHKDKDRRERYITRHKKDLKTNDPMRPGYLSMYILWNKPTVASSLSDYKRRLNSFNRNGKFPKAITGSKKLKFGTLIDFKDEESYLNKLPDDVSELVQKLVSINRLQGAVRARVYPGTLIKDLVEHASNFIKRRRMEHLDPAIKAERDKEMIKNFTENPYVAGDYTQPGFISIWFRRVSSMPSAVFFKPDDTSKNIAKVVAEYLDKYALAGIQSGEVDIDQGDIMDVAIYLLLILIRSGFPKRDVPPSLIEDMSDSYPRVSGADFWRRAHTWWANKTNRNSFGKSGDAPNNVVNKKMYLSIKAKIKRSIKGRRWGAYDSGRLVREYKAKGGKYSGGKGKTNLGRWYKEKWVDACAWPKRKPCGRKTSTKVAYCRPSKRVDSKTPQLVQKLSKTQIKSRCSKKKRSPMKRVTKFGYTIESSQNNMLHSLLSGNDVVINTKRTIDDICKGNFTLPKCQKKFTHFILNMYHTLNLKIPRYAPRVNKLMRLDYPKKGGIERSYYDNNLKELCLLLQDHSFGNFPGANLAWDLYSRMTKFT